MKILKGSTYFAGLLAVAALARPTVALARLLLWPFKLTGGALAPILGFVSGLGSLVGLIRRDWKMACAGAMGVTLAAQFLKDMPDSGEGFAEAFGPDWIQRIPASLQPRLSPLRWALLPQPLGSATWQRDLVYGKKSGTGAPLLADLWTPPPGVAPTGLSVIYIHGGGWRVGDKDLGTRPFFRRLAAQGHAVLDIAYSLWPEGDMPAMIAEVKEAILWLKDNGSRYGLDPERIVLMGGSAGAHLSLLAAYTPEHPSLPPLSGEGDVSVRGVVAFYPPTDLLSFQAPAAEQSSGSESTVSSGSLDPVSEAILDLIFNLHGDDLDGGISFRDFFPAMIGGTPDEVPETYRLLSPLHHVGPHCPPTLLLHGTDDIFDLTPGVRRLHRELLDAGATSILVEFPHTEHAFDLVLPRVSPVAQAAAYDVERFLALLD
jgi:acetyl esterase/lipase